MITRYIGRTSMREINMRLLTLQERRAYSSMRPRKKDLAFLFEPEETFSFQHERDFTAIHDIRKLISYMDTHSVPLIKTHRGGGMIWHGPGQIVLAPVIDLERLKINIPEYTSYLEESCIRTLSHFGVSSFRNHTGHGAEGVWTTDPHTKIAKKIAFLGYYDTRGIAIHGCAINISPNLYPFSLIDPCNLPGVSATSILEILGNAPPIPEAAQRLAEEFSKIISEI